MKNICVMGLGYIGLPTASFLGTKGYKVTGVDISKKIVDTVNAGGVHITEPDLDMLVKSAVQSGNLTASTTPAESDIFIIAVPTPLTDDKKPDLAAVQDATRTICPYLRPGNMVLLESTSPVGTTDRIVAGILREEGFRISDDIFVAHCPERVLPGQILLELIGNDRIVGGVDEASTEAAAEFYQEFVSGQVIRTSAAVAELAKLSENTFRDVNIALANELSMICDDQGLDVWDVIRIANHHPRVNFLRPGPGVGGHCIAVDPWFIVDSAPEKSRLIRAAREINDAKPDWVVRRVTEIARRFKRPKIACLGLTYKPDVDDLRESPAVDVVNKLIAADCGDILVCEPNIASHPDHTLLSVEDAARDADILLVLVGHQAFAKIKPNVLQEKVVIDTVGLFNTGT